MKAKIFLISIFIVASAEAYSPRLTGMGGAGKSGVADEGIFGNPAAIAEVQNITGFAYYTKSRVSDWNSGGRALALGVYDISSEVGKAGFAYVREERSRLVNGRHTDMDRKELRLGFARPITDSINLGVAGRYITRKDAFVETKFSNADGGLKYKAFSDLELGFSYENFLYHDDKEPAPAMNISAQYGQASSFAIYAEGGKIVKGDKDGKRSWSAAVALPMASEFFATVGIYHDRNAELRGKSIGLWWQGPRASFQYGLKVSRGAPVQRDHVVGFTVTF